MSTLPIVKSQFLPPPIRDRFVLRSDLNKKILMIPDYSLTLVHAGAGYGKSTTLGWFSQNSRKAVCWYSIAKHDDDLLPFYTKLNQAINQVLPSFTTFEKIVNIEQKTSSEKVYVLATNFINRLLDFNQDVVLILDDFHHIGSNKEIQKWIIFLIEHLPNNLYLVIASRTKPAWELLSSLRVKGELLEINQKDLQLSSEDMHFMLTEMYQLSVDREDVVNMHELTEGWAIAFNLIAQQLVTGDSLKNLLKQQQTSMQDLFVYLASEVLTKQEKPLQQFLIQSSVLEEMTPEICRDVLQIKDAGEMLAKISRENLFIEGEHPSYRYHALFRAFLKNQLKLTNPKKTCELYGRAAKYFEQKNDIDLALTYFEKLNDYKEITRIINIYGMNMLEKGRLQTLSDLLVKIPSSMKSHYPILYFYQGEIARYRSQYEEAEYLYEKIIRVVPEYDHKQFYLLGLAFEGRARIYLDTIQPEKARRYVKQAINMQEQAKAPKEEMGRLYQFMSENLLNFGEADKASEWFERAQQLGLPMEESNLQARIYLRTGKLAMARTVLVSQEDEQVNKEIGHLPQAHRETDILLSLIEAFMGNLSKSKQLAKKGIELGKRIQSPFVEACGWMRLGHAVQLIDAGDESLAKQYYTYSLNIMEQINISRGKAEPHMGLAVYYGLLQDFDQAENHALKGLIETEKVNDNWLNALIKISLGIAAFHNEKYSKAQEQFYAANQIMQTCGDHYGVMVSSFWYAYIAYYEKNKKDFHKYMDLFLRKIAEEEYWFYLKKRTIFGPQDLQMIVPLLIKAKQVDCNSSIAKRAIVRMGYSEKITNHPGYTLKINTLGRFQLSLGSREIKDKDWQREKSKELIALLLASYGSMLSKEEILDHLWPGEKVKTADQRFKVTLNALLKVIEPERKARAESFYILRKGTTYGLHFEAQIDWDVHRFEKNIKVGLDKSGSELAKGYLEKGLSLYHGEYLPNIRSGWNIDQRNQLQLLFLRGAEKLAQILAQIGNYNRCIDWCEKILAIDETWEEAYRLIMYCYYKQNNRPQAIKWYQTCCQVLEEQLAIEPMATTKNMFQMIMDSE